MGRHRGCGLVRPLCSSVTSVVKSTGERFWDPLQSARRDTEDEAQILISGPSSRFTSFQVEPVRIAAVLHPLVRPVLASSLTRGLMRRLRQWSGPRLSVLDNVAVLDAAAATHLPRR